MKSGERFVFVFPASTVPITADMNADIVRAVYIKKALVEMFIYSELDAVSGSCDISAVIMARNQFTEKQGKIVSKGQQTPLFTLNGPSDNVYMDLATMWYGINTQEARIMVYMTPHRLRGYIQQCFIAAANVGWLPDNWKDICKLTSCGFQTISGKQEDMAFLWSTFLAWSQEPGRHNLWDVAGYSQLAFFECAFKFICLKRARLAECIFKFEDIVDEKGDTFAYLLKTHALVCSLTETSRYRKLFELNKLAGKGRELGLHLVEFTEYHNVDEIVKCKLVLLIKLTFYFQVMEMACQNFMPETVCEYLCNLSKLFMSYYRGASLNQHERNMSGLCKATKVVMNKCFHLLGIAPSLGVWSDEFTSYVQFTSYVHRKEATEFYSSVHHKEARAPYHIIPLSEDARRYLIPNEYLKSRFELFSMTVHVRHSSFDKGNISGCVSVVDTCRSANGWAVLDEKDDGHVCYFDREWYDPVCIYNNSNVPFGNPSSVHSIPFSSFIAVQVMVKATSENNDQTYLLCNRDGFSNL